MFVWRISLSEIEKYHLIMVSCLYDCLCLFIVDILLLLWK